LRAEHARRDDRRDGIRGVVHPVQEVEDEREENDGAKPRG
jgi:hypothetical protein